MPNYALDNADIVREAILRKFPVFIAARFRRSLQFRINASPALALPQIARFLNESPHRLQFTDELVAGAAGSERSDSEDLEYVEIVVIGLAGEAHASLDAATEGKALERRPGCAVIEVLQRREVVGREAHEGHAQLAARDHAGRIGRQTREGDGEVPAHAGVTIGGAYAIVHGGALLGGFAEAESLEGLGNPHKMNGIFVRVGLSRLDKEDRFHLGGSRLSRGAGGLGTSHRGKCG